jgi:hypothetical protein
MIDLNILRCIAVKISFLIKGGSTRYLNCCHYAIATRGYFQGSQGDHMGDVVDKLHKRSLAFDAGPPWLLL